MKFRNLWHLALVVIALWAASPAQAGPWYLGIKGGVMVPNINGMDPAGNLGLQLGREVWSLGYGGLAVELEGTTSMAEGDLSTAEFFGGKWQVNTAALYLAYKTPKDLYLKGKAGFSYVDVSTQRSGNNFSDSTAGLTGGLGAGWKFMEPFALELEATYLSDLELKDDNGSLWFWSLGVNCHF